MTKNQASQCFIAPLLWFGIMNLLSVSPLGYLPFEVPFYGPVMFHQASSFGGYWLLPVLILGTGASLGYFFHERNFIRFLLVVTFASGLGYLGWWGSERIAAEDAKQPLKLALIQHNIKPKTAWNETSLIEVRSAYREFAMMAARLNSSLIVFPSFTLPERELKNTDTLGEISSLVGLPLLFAVHLERKDKAGSNSPLSSVFFYSMAGKLAASFKEEPRESDYFSYLKLRKGPSRLIENEGVKMGVLIHFEDMHSGPAKQAGKEGAQILIIFPDSSLMKSAHLAALLLIQDQLRAIETGLPVARLSSSGPSAYISATGRIMKKTGLNEEAILIADFDS